MDEDDSTFVLLVPPNPRLQDMKLEVKDYNEFRDVLTSCELVSGAESAHQATQVEMAHRVESRGISDGATQTVKCQTSVSKCTQVKLADIPYVGNQADFLLSGEKGTGEFCHPLSISNKRTPEKNYDWNTASLAYTSDKEYGGNTAPRKCTQNKDYNGNVVSLAKAVKDYYRVNANMNIVYPMRRIGYCTESQKLHPVEERDVILENKEVTSGDSEPRSWNSFEHKIESEDKGSQTDINHKMLFKAHIELLSCHLRRLKNLTRKVLRTNQSKLIKFTSEYTTHIYNTARHLLSDELAVVMARDIKATSKLQRNKFWKATHDTDRKKHHKRKQQRIRNQTIPPDKTPDEQTISESIVQEETQREPGEILDTDDDNKPVTPENGLQPEFGAHPALGSRSTTPQRCQGNIPTPELSPRSEPPALRFETTYLKEERSFQDKGCLPDVNRHAGNERAQSTERFESPLHDHDVLSPIVRSHRPFIHSEGDRRLGGELMNMKGIRLHRDSTQLPFPCNRLTHKIGSPTDPELQKRDRGVHLEDTPCVVRDIREHRNGRAGEEVKGLSCKDNGIFSSIEQSITARRRCDAKQAEDSPYVFNNDREFCKGPFRGDFHSDRGQSDVSPYLCDDKMPRDMPYLLSNDSKEFGRPLRRYHDRSPHREICPAPRRFNPSHAGERQRGDSLDPPRRQRKHTPRVGDDSNTDCQNGRPRGEFKGGTHQDTSVASPIIDEQGHHFSSNSRRNPDDLQYLQFYSGRDRSPNRGTFPMSPATIHLNRGAGYHRNQMTPFCDEYKDDNRVGRDRNTPVQDERRTVGRGSKRRHITRGDPGIHPYQEARDQPLEFHRRQRSLSPRILRRDSRDRKTPLHDDRILADRECKRP